jgi:hypothetical protein
MPIETLITLSKKGWLASRFAKVDGLHRVLPKVDEILTLKTSKHGENAMPNRKKC